MAKTTPMQRAYLASSLPATCAKALLLISLLTVSAYPADKLTAPQLIAMAKSSDPNLAAAISATFPAELIWLWRDYDPAKTEPVYEMEAPEKAKPLFRISIVNRDAK